MTEIPNHQVVDAKETLEKILAQKKDVPVKLAYAANKNHDVLSDEAEDLEEFRMELLSDYAETTEEGQIAQRKDEDGNPTGEAKFKSEEDMQSFQKRLNEIWSDSVDLDIYSVDIENVGSYVAPVDWGQNLSFMLENFETVEDTLRGSEIQANVNSIESILSLKDESQKRQFPIKFSTALFRTYGNLIEIQAEIEQRRFDLLDEYAKKDEDGQIQTQKGNANAKFPDEESEKEFQEKLNEIYNEEFEVEGTLVEIDYLDDVELHPRHTIIFDWMLTE